LSVHRGHDRDGQRAVCARKASVAHTVA
jgi:hypothetical protein